MRPSIKRLLKLRVTVAKLRASIALLSLLSGTAGSVMAANEVQVSRVVRGQASVSTSGDVTTVTTSNRAIINFKRLGVVEGHTLNFAQPSAGSRVLGRVTGGEVSRIDGALTSNGTVYLANKAGIIFGPKSVVNVGGLFAAGGNITDQDFLRGNNMFVASPDGVVRNFGSIESTGDVALVAREVVNSGNIASAKGSVFFAAGERIFVGQSGSNVLVDVSRFKPANGAEGQPTAQTQPASLTPRAGLTGDMASLAMNAPTGNVRAKNVVVASADSAVVSGNIDVSSSKTRGGSVTITGSNVALDGARVNASGATGGGSIRVGGDRQGKGDLDRAVTTDVSADSMLRADATKQGDGGSIVVWADNATTFSGSASARGTGADGDGGFIETSGKVSIDYRGATISASSERGRSGQWLIDPTNEKINAARALVIKATLEMGTDVTITTADIAGGVEDGNIDVEAPIVVDLSANGAAKLTLRAANNITVSEKIKATGDALSLELFANDQTLADDLDTAAGSVEVLTGIELNGGSFLARGESFFLDAGGSIDAATVDVSVTGNLDVQSTINALMNVGAMDPDSVSLSAGTDGSGSLMVGPAAVISGDAISLKAGDGQGGATTAAVSIDSTALLQDLTGAAAPERLTVVQDATLATLPFSKANTGGNAAGAVTVESADGSVTLDLVDLADATTNVTVRGADGVEFIGAGSAGSLVVEGNTDGDMVGDVGLTGTFETTGEASFKGASVSLDGDVNIKTGGGKLTFGGLLDGDAGGEALTLDAGMGDIEFENAVGSIRALGQLNFVAARDITTQAVTSRFIRTFDPTLMGGAGDFTSIAGDFTSNGVLTALGGGMDGGLYLNAKNINIFACFKLGTTGGTFIVDAATGRFVISDGGMAGDSESSGNVTVTGRSTLGDDITLSVAGSTLQFTDDVIIEDGRTVVLSANAGEIIFDGRINGDLTTAAVEELEIGGGAITLTFNSDIGTVAPLGSFTPSAGVVVFNANIGTAMMAGVTGATSVTANSMLMGEGTISFNGNVYHTTGAQTYTAKQGILVNGNAGSRNVLFRTTNSALAFNVVSDTAMPLASNINGAVTLFNGVTLTLDTSTAANSGGNLTILADVEGTGTSATSETLIVEAGTGNVRFGRNIGASAVLAALTVDGGDVTFTGNIGTAMAAGVTGDTDIESVDQIFFNGSVYNANKQLYTAANGSVLGGPATSFLSSNDEISFQTTLDGASNLVVNAGATGNVIFGNDIGAGMGTALSSLTVDGNDVTFDGSIGGDGVTGVSGAVDIEAQDQVLFNDRFYTSTGVSSYSGVNGLVFSYAVPNTPVQVQSLDSSLEFTGAIDAAVNDVTELITGSSLDTTFNGDIGVNGRFLSLTIGSTAEDVIFNGNIGGFDNATMTNAPGVSGETIVSSFGQIRFNGTVYNANAQNYIATSGIIFDQSQTLVLSSNDEIQFSGTADGATDLVVSSGTGGVTFGNDIGTNMALSSIKVDAGTVTFGGDIGAVDPVLMTAMEGVTGDISIGSSGQIRFNGEVYNANTQTYTAATGLRFSKAGVLVQSSNDFIDFDGTVSGTASGVTNLAVNAGSGNVRFGGSIGVGMTSPLASLTVDGTDVTFTENIGSAMAAGVTGNTDVAALGQIFFDGTTYNANTQLYTAANGSLFSQAATTFLSSNDEINFQSTLDGATDLTVNALAGNVIFGDDIGVTTALFSLTVDGNDVTFTQNIGTALLVGVTGNTDVGALGQIFFDGTTYNANKQLYTAANGSLFSEAATEFLSSDDEINFQTTLDGATDLTVNAITGDVIFGGDVGVNQALASLTVDGNDVTFDANIGAFDGMAMINTPGVSGLTDIGAANQIFFNGSVYNANQQLYTAANGSVLGGPSTDFLSSDDEINFQSTLDGVTDLTVDALAGNVVFGGDIGVNMALTSLTVDGTDVTFTQNIGSNADAGVTGNTDVDALGQIFFDGTTYNANTQLYTAANGSLFSEAATAFLSSDDEINFQSTLDGVTDLTVDALAGNVVFGGDIGVNMALTSLTVDGTDVTFSQNIGTDMLAGVMGNTDVDALGRINFDGTNYNTTGSQEYSAASGHFFSQGMVDVRTADSLIGFDGAVDGTAQGVTNLVVDAGTGDVDFNGTIGAGVDGALASLTVDANDVTFDGNIGTGMAEGVTGETDVNALDEIFFNGSVYNGNKQLYTAANGSFFADPTTDFLSSDDEINFQSTLDGATDLLVNAGLGDVIFGGDIGTGMNGALTSLTVDGNDVTFTGNIGTGMAQGITGDTDVEAQDEIFFDGTTYNANKQLYTAANGAFFSEMLTGFLSSDDEINFQTSLDGATDLVVNAFAGDVIFGDDIGATTALSSLTVDGNDVTFTGNIGTDMLAGVMGDTDVEAGSRIDFNGTVYNANKQTYTAANGVDVFTSALFQTSDDEIRFVVTDAVDPMDPTVALRIHNGVVMTVNTEDAMNAATGRLTVDAAVSGEGELILLTVHDAAFNQQVTELTNFDINSTGSVSLQLVDITGPLDITGEGLVTLNDPTVTALQSINIENPVALNAGVTMSSNGPISLLDLVTGNSFSLDLNTSNLTTIGGVITGVSTLRTNAGGSTTILANVTANDSITFNDDVLVDEVVTLTAGDFITFNDDVELANNLTLNADDATFAQTLTGNGSNLTLQIGDVTTFDGVVTTLGTLTTLATGQTVVNDDFGGADLTFSNQVIIGSSLTIAATTQVTFEQLVGGATSSQFALIVDSPLMNFEAGATLLQSLTIGATAGTGTANVEDLFSVGTGGLLVNSAFVLTGNTTVASGGDVNFQSSINGPFSLDITGPTSRFGGIVGGAAALTNLNVTASAIRIDTTAISASTTRFTGGVQLLKPTLAINAPTSLTIVGSTTSAARTALNVTSPLVNVTGDLGSVGGELSALRFIQSTSNITNITGTARLVDGLADFGGRTRLTGGVLMTGDTGVLRFFGETTIVDAGQLYDINVDLANNGMGRIEFRNVLKLEGDEVRLRLDGYNSQGIFFVGARSADGQPLVAIDSASRTDLYVLTSTETPPPVVATSNAPGSVGEVQDYPAVLVPVIAFGGDVRVGNLFLNTETRPTAGGTPNRSSVPGVATIYVGRLTLGQTASGALTLDVTHAGTDPVVEAIGSNLMVTPPELEQVRFDTNDFVMGFYERMTSLADLRIQALSSDGVAGPEVYLSDIASLGDLEVIAGPDPLILTETGPRGSIHILRRPSSPQWQFIATDAGRVNRTDSNTTFQIPGILGVAEQRASNAIDTPVNDTGVDFVAATELLRFEAGFVDQFLPGGLDPLAPAPLSARFARRGAQPGERIAFIDTAVRNFRTDMFFAVQDGAGVKVFNNLIFNSGDFENLGRSTVLDFTALGFIDSLDPVSAVVLDDLTPPAIEPSRTLLSLADRDLINEAIDVDLRDPSTDQLLAGLGGWWTIDDSLIQTGLKKMSITIDRVSADGVENLVDTLKQLEGKADENELILGAVEEARDDLRSGRAKGDPILPSEILAHPEVAGNPQVMEGLTRRARVWLALEGFGLSPGELSSVRSRLAYIWFKDRSGLYASIMSEMVKTLPRSGTITPLAPAPTPEPDGQRELEAKADEPARPIALRTDSAPATDLPSGL